MKTVFILCIVARLPHLVNAYRVITMLRRSHDKFVRDGIVDLVSNVQMRIANGSSRRKFAVIELS